jgi:WD40 repeat protein
MSKLSREEENDDSGDDFGPLPPPAAVEDSGEEVGQNPPSEAPATSLYENYRKRIVQVETKPASTASTGQSKKPDAWYVYGKDEIPSSAAVESESAYEERLRQVKEASPSGDYDMDVLMDDENAKILPIRFEAYLKAHTKPIAALAWDPKGVRLVSSGADFNLRFWDFSSMDKSLQSFRSMEPTENNVVHTIEWSKQGDKILIAANTPQAQILDREGRKQIETPRGYQYTTDMSHTTGHISPITRAVWNPSDSASFVTCGHDSTVRFWNIEEVKKHKILIKLKSDRGLSNIKPTCLNFSESGDLLAVACDDGSLQFFPSKGPYMKPSIRISEAHMPGSETSDVRFVPGSNEQLLASRGGDDFLRLWDVRNVKTPLTAFPGLSNRFAQTSIAFKPNGEVMATGTSNTRNGDPGSIFFFHIKTLQLMKIIDISSESVIALRWHKDTNQILAGCGNGTISVLFDPEISQKGILTPLSKTLRRVSSQKTSEIDIITPNAPQELNERQRKAAARKDPITSHKPIQPVSGRGSAGLLGSNLKADMMKKMMSNGRDVHEDPRAALLKHASEETSANKSDLDYEGLERINAAEKARAEAMERAQRSKDRA